MIAVVVGVRPEIIKMSPIVHALHARHVPHVVCYTNQHALAEMSDVFFKALKYAPAWRLTGQFTPGRALDELAWVFKQLGVTTVVCLGDTTTTMMAALAGTYAGIRIVHVEAGLRSFDPHMLEERHRRAVDHIAHDLLAYTPMQEAQLRGEQVRGAITVVGNPMVDVIEQLRPEMGQFSWPTPFMYVTMHRKEFTDHPGRMEQVFKAIATAAANMDGTAWRKEPLEVVYPAHPRTKDCFARSGGTWPFEPCAPIGVVESLARIQQAAVVVTDSGGVQEEAAILGTPCVTVRENTERWETLADGANVVSGFEPDRVIAAIRSALGQKGWTSPYGDVGVGQRIVDVLVADGSTRQSMEGL